MPALASLPVSGTLATPAAGPRTQTPTRKICLTAAELWADTARVPSPACLCETLCRSREKHNGVPKPQHHQLLPRGPSHRAQLPQERYGDPPPRPFSVPLGMPPSASEFSGTPNLISHLGMPPRASANSGMPSLFSPLNQYNSNELKNEDAPCCGVTHTNTTPALSLLAEPCTTHVIPQTYTQPTGPPIQAQPKRTEATPPSLLAGNPCPPVRRPRCTPPTPLQRLSLPPYSTGTFSPRPH